MTTVNSDVVLPVTILNGLITLCGTVVFLILGKNSTIKFADEKAVTKAKENDAEFFGFLSPVHAFAVLYFFVFMLYSVAAIFQTSITGVSSCDAVFWIMNLTPAYAKVAQYGFFIMRMYYVFKESNVRVPDSTMKGLVGVVAYYAIVQTILLSLHRYEIPNLSTNTVGGQTFSVCVFKPPEIKPLTVAIVLNYLLVDTIVMISVVYGFVSRLLTLLPKAVGDEFPAVILRAGLYSIISTVFSYLFVVLILFKAENMVGTSALYIDLVVNLVLILLSLRDVAQNEVLSSGSWKRQLVDMSSA